MRKVLGFDSWTGGSRFYQWLVEPLRDQGVELVLLHLGSWGVDPGRVKEEHIDNLLVRDISYYNGKDFLQILDIEKPDAVIFLSTSTFSHRAFNRLCFMRKIPTLNLYHGLMTALAVDSERPYKINIISQVRFVSERILKMLTKVWPAYIQALWSTKASLEDWSRFFQDNIDFARGKYIAVTSPDAKTDICCVYTKADMDHAIQRYGFPTDAVIPVGNPDLMQFGFDESVIASSLMNQWTDKTDIMYIDTGLIYRGATFTDAADYLRHLESVNQMMNKIGKTLIVKLHPHHFRTNFPDSLSKLGIGLCKTEEFIHRLQNCCAALVEPSSVSLIPALIGLPLLLVKFGKMRDQQYGTLLRHYPRSRELEEVDHIVDVLEKEQATCNYSFVRNWIDENKGPLPAELMPTRVAHVIMKMINQRKS